jgi:hypothetical protein
MWHREYGEYFALEKIQPAAVKKLTPVKAKQTQVLRCFVTTLPDMR